MNLSGFKKLKEDKKTVTMAHPEGHSITILKSKLPAIQKKQLEKLPLHLADGDPDVQAPADDIQAVPTTAKGAVDNFVDNDAGGQAMDASQQPDPALSADKFQAAVDKQNALLNGTPVPMGADAAAPASPGNGEVGPANATPATGLSVASSPVDLNKAYGQGQNAIKENADVASQLSNSLAKIDQDQILAKQDLQKNQDENLAAFTKHKDDFASYIAANPINEKHYAESMGSGQKVATAIGLLLGGFTGGFNRTGVNPAAEWLNQQIGRDIEGQKARQDQQKTILGANQELYQDQTLANNATRINLNDIYSQKIKQAADQLGTPLAKANADAALSHLAFDSSDRLRQNAIYSGVQQALKQNGGAGLDPIALGQVGYMKPEEAQKEQASIDKQNAVIKNLSSLYSQAGVEASPSKILNPASSTRLATINAGISDALLSTDVAHRISPESKDLFLKPYMISTRDAVQGTVATKLQAALDKAKEFSAGQTPITARLAPNALPKYPTAAPQVQTKTVNGVTYQRGPNGEAIPVK